MASNQTKNYGLSQWELNDNVRMEDFNSDNAKIDAALANRYGPGNPGWSMGSYVGNGSTTAYEVRIGFRPSALVIVGLSAGCGFMIDDGTQSSSISTYVYSGDLIWNYNYIQATDDGFAVRMLSTNYTSSVNDSGKSYLYIAFR